MDLASLKYKMTDDDVMVVLDVNGELYNKYSTGKDLVIGNRHPFREKSVLWNIFKDLTINDGNLDEIYSLSRKMSEKAILTIKLYRGYLKNGEQTISAVFFLRTIICLILYH